MIKWAEKNKYNSFNSYKGLTYLDSHYIPTAKWFKGKGELPPPIELSLDPIHECNYACPHCNSQRYILGKDIPDKRKMSRDHLYNLMDFCANWGVRGVCIAGGGEPLMNKDVWNLPSYIAKKGMASSFLTNGSLINKDIAEEMMHCRWVGISVDAGDRETFKRVHGVDMFDKVIKNLKLLVETKKRIGSKVEIAFKFLILPTNYESLFKACKLAKDIGVDDFHARPVDLERKDFKSTIKLNYNMPRILNIFDDCHTLKTEDFHVYTVMHKFDPDFKVKHPFKKCVSSSLMIKACADDNVYVCVDHGVEERFKLGTHNPPENILNFWGSKEHRKLLLSVNPNKECSRCTYGEYARQIEKLTMGGNDPMCVDFP